MAMPAVLGYGEPSGGGGSKRQVVNRKGTPRVDHGNAFERRFPILICDWQPRRLPRRGRCCQHSDSRRRPSSPLPVSASACGRPSQTRYGPSSPGGSCPSGAAGAKRRRGPFCTPWTALRSTPSRRRLKSSVPYSCSQVGSTSSQRCLAVGRLGRIWCPFGGEPHQLGRFVTR